MAEVRISSPFPQWAWPSVWEWIQTFRSRVADDFAPRTVDEFVRFEVSRQRQERTWAVWRDDELGGLVTFQPWNPAVGAAHCLFKRAFWGTGVTLPALRMVAREIFDGGVINIVCMVFPDNDGMRALLRQLGAREARDRLVATVRDGKPAAMSLWQLGKEKFDATGSFGRRARGRVGHVGGSERPQQDDHKQAALHSGAGSDAGATGADAAIPDGESGSGTGAAQDRRD